MIGMRRREFIMLLGGAVASLPVAAPAQPEQLRRVGIFMDLSEQDQEGQTRVAAFRKGLQDLGGLRAATSGLTFAGPLATPPACDATQLNSSA